MRVRALDAVVGAFVLLLAVGLLVFAPPAPQSAEATSSVDDVVDITFPVDGKVSYIDDYLSCRGGSGCPRRHLATDVMTAYGTPVHAAVGGTISFITGIDAAVPSYGYMIRIAGDDGRTYNYIHLGRQDKGPWEAYEPGMRRGLRVERGQRIGFAGCSGNASCSAPHLHFEIVDSAVSDDFGSNRVNPYRSLKAAESRGDYPRGCTGQSYALVGDWDGSGVDGLGWWCDGRTRLMTASGVVHEFNYGRAGDVPVVADWDGDGAASVSVIRDGTWHVNNALRGGASERTFVYGRVSRGDVPIAGAWDRGSRDLPGIVRDREWHLRGSQSGGAATWQFVYGRLTRGDLPLWGDWNGDGRDTVGIVRDGQWHLRNSHAGGPADVSFVYGRVLAGDRPVVGDWNGDGRDTPGIVRGGEWHLRHINAGGKADRTVTFPPP